jgi:hypothetical protein
MTTSNPTWELTLSIIAVTRAQRVESFYSLRSKMKFMFGLKLCYEIKGTFGEIPLKLCPTYWNVARISVNVVDDELLSHTIVYTCSTIYIWTRRRRRTSTRSYALRCHPSKMAGFQ